MIRVKVRDVSADSGKLFDAGSFHPDHVGPLAKLFERTRFFGEAGYDEVPAEVAPQIVCEDGECYVELVVSMEDE